MNNLRKFSTEADYSAATLNYPAVSWVVSGDTVHYDLSASTPTVNTKVKIAFTTDSCGTQYAVAGDSSMINDGIVTAITVNGEALQLSSSMVALQLSANTDYLIEYSLADGVSDVGSYFALGGPGGCSSNHYHYDILFPAQVTNIGQLFTSYINTLILESTTPPTTSLSGSDIPSNIYVPDSAVSTYEETVWYHSGSIHPISQYSGNIPV